MVEGKKLQFDDFRSTREASPYKEKTAPVQGITSEREKERDQQEKGVRGGVQKEKAFPDRNKRRRQNGAVNFDGEKD